MNLDVARSVITVGTWLTSAVGGEEEIVLLILAEELFFVLYFRSNVISQNDREIEQVSCAL